MPHDIRFGTWIVSINFCYHYFEEIVKFTKALKPEVSTTPGQVSVVNKLKKLVADHEKDLISQIRFIHHTYGRLPVYILQLEASKLTFMQAFEVVKKLETYLTAPLDTDLETGFKKCVIDVKNKFIADQAKNPGFYEIHKLCLNIEGTPYLFAVIHSCGPERMFAKFRREYCEDTKQSTSPEQVKKETTVKFSARPDSVADRDSSSSDDSSSYDSSSDDSSSEDEEESERIRQDIDYWGEVNFSHVLK